MRLSICIPTFNRKEYLDECVRSFVEQIKNNTVLKRNVEIVISDNHSSDGTIDYLNSLGRLYPNIYFKININKSNNGPDYNYIKVVECASGEYCWIVGSDDKCAKGCLAELYRGIESGADIYVFNRVNCSKKEMKPINMESFMIDGTKGRVYSIKRDEDIIAYFNDCISLGGMFSYLSTTVFKKAQWDAVDGYEKFIGSSYVHVYKLFEIIKRKNIVIEFDPRGYINNRVGNDSFFKSALQRLTLDIDGYTSLIELFESQAIRFSILDCIRRYYSVPNLRILLLGKRKQVNKMLEKFRLIGYSNREIQLYRHLSYCKIAILTYVLKERIQSRIKSSVNDKIEERMHK